MPAAGTMARSDRNNNPGNLMDVRIKWDGLVRADAENYCIFATQKHGYRALALDLLNDWAGDGKRSVRALISEFAPPGHTVAGHTNTTEDYVAFVAKALDVSPDVGIDLGSMLMLEGLMAAIAHFERGAAIPAGHWVALSQGAAAAVAYRARIKEAAQ